MAYRIIVVPGDIAEKARHTMTSPQYGHPAHKEVASGYGPCRVCLQKFKEGEEDRVLFTYNPFGENSVPAPGPIFVHHDTCSAYQEEIFPDELRDLALLLEGYSADSQPVDREIIKDGNLEPTIDRFFAGSAVEYVHVRNAIAGCFICRIERI